MLSAIPPFFTAIADTIFLFLIFSVIKSKFAFNSSSFGKSFSSFGVVIKYTLFPAFLNSLEITFSASVTLTANDTNVGGTEISLNVPLIESFPPIDGNPKAF